MATFLTAASSIAASLLVEVQWSFVIVSSFNTAFIGLTSITLTILDAPLLFCRYDEHPPNRDNLTGRNRMNYEKQKRRARRELREHQCQQIIEEHGYPRSMDRLLMMLEIAFEVGREHKQHEHPEIIG